MVTIRVFLTRGEADIVKALLEQHGIFAMIFADDQGGMRPAMTFMNGVGLRVNDEDAEMANKIIDDALKSSHLKLV